MEPGTAPQSANHGDDLLVYAYGYPPETEASERLDRPRSFPPMAEWIFLHTPREDFAATMTDEEKRAGAAR